MTDTRSPEQRREDEYNLAYVQRVARMEEAFESLRTPSSPAYVEPAPEPVAYIGAELVAYRNGRHAGRCGWTRKFGSGMEECEVAWARAKRADLLDAWEAGYSDGERS